MKIILAQGNPEIQYAKTRHNVGWQLLDIYAKRHDISFVPKPKFFATIAEFLLNGEKVLLVKPDTYYNETGRSARALVDFYKLDTLSDVLVIHDDLALPFGTIRTREKGSDAGNNGIKSLNTYIGHDYARIRIGIHNELHSKIPDADFVLSQFAKAEQATLLRSIIPTAADIIDSFVADSFQTTTRT